MCNLHIKARPENLGENKPRRANDPCRMPRPMRSHGSCPFHSLKQQLDAPRLAKRKGGASCSLASLHGTSPTSAGSSVLFPIFLSTRSQWRQSPPP